MAHGGGEVGGDDHTTRYTRAAMYIHRYIYILSNATKYINMEPLRCEQSNIHVLHVRGVKHADVTGLLGHGFT